MPTLFGFRNHGRLLLCALSMALAFANPAHAALYYWTTTGSDTNWSTAR